MLEHLWEVRPLLLAVVGELPGDGPHRGDLRGHVGQDLLGHLGESGVCKGAKLCHLLARVDVQPRHVVLPEGVAGHVVVDRLGVGRGGGTLLMIAGRPST